MKTVCASVCLILCAAVVTAGTVVDLQSGVYAPGDAVTVNAAVVTGVTATGLYISEDPVVPAAGVFVVTGGSPPTAIGDLVHVKGLYQELDGRTVLHVQDDPTGFLTVAGPHLGEIFPLSLGLADLGELYEGCYVQVDEGMHVSAAPDGAGVWQMDSFENPELSLTLAGTWFDSGTVATGDCASCARGILAFEEGEYRLLPHDTGLCRIDCTVGNTVQSFGGLKTAYR